MVAHVFNPKTGEAEAGGALCVQGQPIVHGEFQVSQGYVARPYLKKKNYFFLHMYALCVQLSAAGSGEKNLCLLGEQQVLLTTEPCL